jgi:hypothetical protein
MHLEVIDFSVYRVYGWCDGAGNLLYNLRAALGLLSQDPDNALRSVEVPQVLSQDLFNAVRLDIIRARESLRESLCGI